MGYALAGDDQVIAFDFDNVIDKEGKITDAKIARLLRDLKTWVEYSPSGNGLHAWCAVSPALKKRMQERIGAWTPFTQKGGGGEKHSVYANGGYVTVTGRPYRAASSSFNIDSDAFIQQWFRLRSRFRCGA